MTSVTEENMRMIREACRKPSPYIRKSAWQWIWFWVSYPWTLAMMLREIDRLSNEVKRLQRPITLEIRKERNKLAAETIVAKKIAALNHENDALTRTLAQLRVAR